MEIIGAGLAALGVLGPGIGIGLLGGCPSSAIGRNPDAAGQIRGLAIILAAFAEGLGVLAVVVGLLPSSSPGRGLAVAARETTVDILAVAAGAAGAAASLAAEDGGETAGLTINLFWVLVSAINFILLFAIVWTFAFKPLAKTLDDRKAAIEQGLKDAEQARQDRDSAEVGARRALTEARREANDILARAQKVAQETRDADIAATRDELERMRTRATAEIEAEKTRAIAELRGEVADLALAAAGRVVGESMTDERQRRLVQEFLATTDLAAIGATDRWPDGTAPRAATRRPPSRSATRDGTLETWRIGARAGSGSPGR